MAKGTHGARISPSIRLEKIEIRLSDYEPPTIEMTGRLATGNRRADMASTVTIKSGLIGPVTNEFIAEIKKAFTDRTNIEGGK
jgi:hypothetical protein